MKLAEYLESMEGQLEGRSRDSKVEATLIETVREYMLEGKPTTVKELGADMGKRIQHIHSIVTKSEKRGGLLKRAKVNGRTLIVVDEDVIDED